MMTIDDLLPHLSRYRASTGDTIADLVIFRQRIEEAARRLESPQGILEFVDFFSGFFTEAAAALERIEAELPQGVQRVHIDLLRQLASNAAVEGRRCLKFRDKWINRPLPYEDVRPLLNAISNDTRDRLASYRDLNATADELDALAGPAPAPVDAGLDRRALFTKWFGR